LEFSAVKEVPIPLSDRMKGAFIRSLYALLACLPLRAIQLLGAGLGNALWLCRTELARTSLINIHLCFPELSAKEQKKLARQSLLETGKTMLETGACWNWSLEKCRSLIRNIEGEQLFAERCADPRGLILLLPHLCTWEMLHPVLSAHTAFTAMFKPPQIRSLDDWMQKVRNRSSAVMVPANRRGVSELMKALKNGQCIVVLPDQEPERESGSFAPFFGLEALTVSLVHGLATKTHAQLLMVNTKRLADGSGFDVVFRDANTVNTPDLRQSLTAMNTIVETAVREIPAQYQWEYKRFKQGAQKRTKYYFSEDRKTRPKNHRTKGANSVRKGLKKRKR
jgi:KDO2-lipid IV(A) lauroyltransferase